MDREVLFGNKVKDIAIVNSFFDQRAKQYQLVQSRSNAESRRLLVRQWKKSNRNLYIQFKRLCLEGNWFG